MKLLIVLASVVLAINAATDLELWSEFKQNYGRQYRNLREEKERFSIFKSNLRTIEEHNEKYNKGESSYYMGINQFADKTRQEYRNMLNYSAAARPIRQKTTLYKESGLQAPDSVNWVDKGVVTHVKNQGYCGSCWAFSTIGCLEGIYALATGNLIALSEQNLMDCNTENGACDGGWEEVAFDYIRDNGIEKEEDYPYTEVQGTCQFDSSRSVTSVSGYVSISQDEYSLLDAVANVGPISIAVNADGYDYYAGGIYDDSSCNKDDLNHAVLLVGYGTENNVPYWLVKNSWGADWGESGYIRMVRNKDNQCGIADDGIYPTLKIIIKIFIVFASILLAINAATDLELWTEFKQKNGRQYRNLREEKERYSIFKDNLRTIEKHNEKYNRGESTYYMGITKFTDITLQEFQNLLNYSAGTRPSRKGAPLYKVSGLELPSSIDWVSKGAVTGIKDQQDCGSCWAFSAVAALERFYALQTGTLESLSEQNLLDCDPTGDCDGGWQEGAFEYVRDNGIEREADYPYESAEGSCRYSSSKSLFSVRGFVAVPQDENSLQDALVNVGPLAISVDASQFPWYSGGIYDEPTCDPNTLNHGVALVGYGTLNNVEYYLVKNSWGLNWGDKGYIKMRRNNNDQCGIALDGSYHGWMDV